MQAVHFVQRDEIDVAFHLFDREEVARDVEHGAAPDEAGAVDDPSARYTERTRLVEPRRRVLDERRQQLPERLHAVEHAGGGPAFDGGPCRHHRDLVRLIAGFGDVAELKFDHALSRGAILRRHTQRLGTRRQTDNAGQRTPDAQESFVSRRNADDRR